MLFAGRSGTTIPAGRRSLSDPVDLKVGGLTSLSISLYFPADTGPCTCHATGVQSGFVSDVGDFTAKAFTPVEDDSVSRVHLGRRGGVGYAVALRRHAR